MVLAALTSAGQIVALVIGLTGLAGVIFTALKYNRDDTTAIVNQQSAIVAEMTALTTELRHQRDDCREELRGRA